MTPLEGQPVARSRTVLFVVLAAMLVLALIAAVAVVAFVRLDLLQRPGLETGGASNPPAVAPAPTHIRPELYSPPSTWDDNVG
jgi:hypothetical protein